MIRVSQEGRAKAISRERSLAKLDGVVNAAVEFFMKADGQLLDGEQSAREVIAHLVFWHAEYVRIAAALAANRSPRLLTGRFLDWNARATERFGSEPLPVLAQKLARSQSQLHGELMRVPNWRVKFPIKAESSHSTVSEWIPRVQAHLAGHLLRLQRARRRQAVRAP